MQLNKQKLIVAVIIIILVIAMVVFACLWQKQLDNKEDIELLAKISANEALEYFENYIEEQNESSYWLGVAKFDTFSTTLQLLESKNTSGELDSNQIAWLLKVNPQAGKEHLDILIESLEILSKDPYDYNGYTKYGGLRAALESASE